MSHQLNIGGTTRSLRLFRKLDSQKNEGPASYTITEDVPRYVNPLSFVWNDWSGGHGQYKWNNPSKYAIGNNVEASFPGMIAIIPSKETPSVFHIVDAAVADDGGVMTTETTGAQNSTTNDMTLLPATPATNDAYYFLADNPTNTTGVNTLKLWVSTAGVGTWTITWEYWNGSAYTAAASVTDGSNGFTTSGYVNVSFATTNWATATVNSITGKYPLRARVSAYTSKTTQPKGRMAWFQEDDMGAAPVVSTWYKTNGTQFVATATKLFESDTSWTYWLERLLLSGETITDLKEHDSLLYVGLGNSTRWYYTSDGLTFTQTDLTDGYSQRFLVAPNPAGTEDRLWFFQTPNEVMHTSDGRTVAAGGVQASTPAYIGDTSYNITNIFLVNDKIMVGRQNGLWYYDMIGGQHQLMQELELHRSSTNFKYVAYYKGATYFSLLRNIGEITASDYLSIIGPLKEYDVPLTKSGDIVGMTSDEDFLYVAIDEGTDTYIYKGSQVVGSDGALIWAWHCIYNLQTSTCTLLSMVQVNIASGALSLLLFAKNNNVCYIVLSRNPLVTQSSTSFQPINSEDTWVRSSYFYGSNPHWDKIWQSVEIETQNCSATAYATIYYRDDNDSSSTAISSSITSNGVQEIKLSSAITNKRCAFEIWLYTDTAYTSPVVTYFEAKGIEVPEVTKVHECVYEVGDSSSVKAKTLWDFLDSARTSTTLVKLADLRRGQKTSGTAIGDYVWVIMQPGYPKFIEVADENGRHPEMGIQCRWQEVDWTIS